MKNLEFFLTKEERKQLITKEKKRLRTVYKKLEPKKLKTAEKLIDNAAFMAVTLEETMEIINRDGIIEPYQNGENQSGIKKSSAVEVYDKMLNTYSKVIKQLCDLLPQQDAADPGEEIMKFISSGNR